MKPPIMDTGRKILEAIGVLKNGANRLLWSFLAVSLVVHGWALAVASRYLHQQSLQVIELELSAPPEKKVTVSPPPRGLPHQESEHQLPVPDVTPVVATIPQPPMPPKPVPAPQDSQSVQVPQVLPQAQPEVNPPVARNVPDEKSSTRQVEPSPPAASASSVARMRAGNPQGVATEASQGNLEDALNRFLAGVRLRIDRCKRYPFVARRRHMEGRVRLRFSIEPNGSAHGVQVVQSSGYRPLDRAAMEAVQRAAPFPGFPRQLSERALSVEIGIVFHLT